MNKKGFTLVELLAVIVILGLLIAIVSPAVMNLIDNSEESLSKQQKDLIVTASKKYMIEHSELLPEDDNRFIIYADDLINNGVIDNDKIIDPKTNEEINGCVVVSYNNEFNQYEYNYSDNENDCLITVTFDPEGGSVSETSRKVKFNSTYGELPTPTREGYTFKGWRGKNMFDEETILMAIDGAKYENGYYVFNSYYAHTKYKKSVGGFLSDFKEDTQYRLSIIGHSTARTNGTLFISFNYSDGSSLEEYINKVDDQEYYLLSSTTKNIDYMAFSYGYGGNCYIKQVQIEEGNVTTEYEPYQEYSDDTIVTKSSNHVLHAIWEVAS